MLPWLFAVLLVLNLSLFWWGRQHEVPIEPELPPVPEAPYHIQLLGEESTTEERSSTELDQSIDRQVPDTVPLDEAKSIAQDRPPTVGTEDNTQGPGGEIPAPDEGAVPDSVSFVEHLGPLNQDELATSPRPVYFPDPDPSEIPVSNNEVSTAAPADANSPAKTNAGASLPAGEAAAKAAIAGAGAAAAADSDQSKPAAKRKAKRHKRKRAQAAPVEVPPPLP